MPDGGFILKTPDGQEISVGEIVKSNDVEGLKKELAGIGDLVKNFATDVNAKIVHGQEISQEIMGRVDQALTAQGEIRARVDELEQKAARRGGESAASSYRTPGSVFVNDERVKEFCSSRTRGRVRVDMAAITTAGVGATRDVLVPVDRQQGILTLPDRRLTVRDLLTPGRTGSNAIQYVRETGFTNNAAVVSEGALKPESDVDFELITTPVTTIAHWMVASKQILEDAPALESHIDGRLRYGLAYAEENELLNGDGTGVHLDGLIPNATAYSAPFSYSSPTMIDTIRLAILQSELALFPATGVVMNPIDWTHIELTKDSQGRYIFAQVQGLATKTLWGRSIVDTPAMTVDKYLVGAFKLGAQIFDREDANVEISTEDSDNFRKNLVTIRAEERLALAVYRPESFIKGTFTTALAA
jgi:HK97 family phage major capsid protein